MKHGPLHFRAYAVTVGWTLVLLYLGSVVHATGSSLACPDWPTCHGTMMPDMEGGVFWEHLHRLVAGGLILMFALATWLARSEVPEQPWLFRTSLMGMGLLLVQAVFGGITVLLKLPDWVSTTHLALALLFLSLATCLAAVTSPRRANRPWATPAVRRELRTWGGVTSAMVLLQSVLGGAVRHMGAGMACPDVPTCQGSWLPPLDFPLVRVHFAHRVLAVLTMLVVLAVAAKLIRTGLPHVRHAAQAMAALVVLQVGLGVVSVTTRLGVLPVSLHTLVAASLLSLAVLLTAWGALPSGSPGSEEGAREAVDPARSVSGG